MLNAKRYYIYSPSGAGQQCCYDVGGNILPFDQGGGTHDKAHHKGAYSASVSGSGSAGITVDATAISGSAQGNINIGVTIIKLPIISHFIEDVWPFIFCCKLSTLYCAKYSDARPTDDCTDYIPPRPGKFLLW